MYEIKDKEEYEETVMALISEYQDKLHQDHETAEQKERLYQVAEDIAYGVIGSSTVLNGKPVIEHTATVWGKRVDSLDGQTLSPYQVINYTNTEEIGLYRGHPTEKIAAKSLASDIVQTVDDSVGETEEENLP